MKKIIIISFSFFLCYCKQDKKEIVLSKKEHLNEFSFYNLIFDELKDVDVDKYHLTYKIYDDLKISNKEINYLEKKELIPKNQILSKKIGNRYKKELPNRINKIFNNSKIKNSKKMELHYAFSKPYSFNENKVLIFNETTYSTHLSNAVKGGGKRVFLFIKENNLWSIKKVVNLSDY